MDDLLGKKRPRTDAGTSTLPAATSGLIQINGANALPQMSTDRMKEALAAGDPTARQSKPLFNGAIPPVLCRFHLQGGCHKGTACTFSHDATVMPTVKLEEKLQAPCRFFEAGSCMRGAACKYIHGVEERRAIQAARYGGKKKAKKGDEDADASAAPPEPPQEPDAMAVGLSKASGFQSFDNFDLQSAGPTDLQAGPDSIEQGMEPQNIDFAFAEFLAEMGADEPTAMPAAVPRREAVADANGGAEMSKKPKVVTPPSNGIPAPARVAWRSLAPDLEFKWR